MGNKDRQKREIKKKKAEKDTVKHKAAEKSDITKPIKF
jgi:hypothetical protein